ncbi:MAG: PAS domain-containing protein [Cyclobacteriaceae bacterium]
MEKLKILLLEDVEVDAELTLYEFRKAALDYEHIRVENLEDFRSQLSEFDPDIIISDYNLPTCNALDAFEVAHKKDTPFIIVSGAIGEEKAVEALKRGVTDYVSKDSLSRLPYVLDRAMNEQRVKNEKVLAETELKQSKQRLELALTGAELGTWDWDIQSNNVIYNERAAEIFELPFKSFGEDLKLIYDKVHPDSLKEGLMTLKSHFLGENPLFESEVRIRNGDTWKWVVIKGKIIRNLYDKDALRASGTIQDINARKLAQEQLLRSQQMLSEAQKIAKIGSFEWSYESGLGYCSDEFYNIFEISRNQLPEDFDFYFNHVYNDDIGLVNEIIYKERKGIQYYDLDHRMMTDNGTVKIIRSRGQITFDELQKPIRVIGTILDITEARENKKALYRGQELERKRLARELHDGIGQMLIATKYKVANVAGEVPNDPIGLSLEEVENFLDNVIDETRRISRNLSSRMIEEFGLSKALELMIEELSNISGLKIIHQIQKIDILSDDVEIAIYRISQESISNAIKYAEASEVSILLDQRNTNVMLSIEDNGIGFDEKTMNNSTGSGLRNMKDRVSSVNGYIEISSVPKKGTLIKSWFPLT